MLAPELGTRDNSCDNLTIVACCITAIIWCQAKNLIIIPHAEHFSYFSVPQKDSNIVAFCLLQCSKWSQAQLWQAHMLNAIHTYEASHTIVASRPVFICSRILVYSVQYFAPCFGSGSGWIRVFSPIRVRVLKVRIRTLINLWDLNDGFDKVLEKLFLHVPTLPCHERKISSSSYHPLGSVQSAGIEPRE